MDDIIDKIQKLGPHRERVMGEYIKMKLRHRERLGWEKVNMEIQKNVRYFSELKVQSLRQYIPYPQVGVANPQLEVILYPEVPQAVLHVQNHA